MVSNVYHSSVFSTFSHAGKAFDKVNFCKLFRVLLERRLPSCIIRVLINMYVSLQAGTLSDYFSILNGVRQGGVLLY